MMRKNNFHIRGRRHDIQGVKFQIVEILKFFDSF